MDTKQIILSDRKNKASDVSDTLLNVSIENDVKEISTENIEAKFNQYKQYIKEKDASTKYRFNFTISPICSNVLFNRVTEITKDEGSSGVTFITQQGKTGTTSFDDYYEYATYKYGAEWYSGATINRHTMVSDTAFSHEECGNMEYKCGVDIFNNHYFRGSEFTFINRMSGNTSSQYYGNADFNTLFDVCRENDGSSIETPTSTAVTVDHVYTLSNSVSYSNSIENNLLEENGWFGFKNKMKLPIDNAKVSGNTISINKVINNKKGNSFIDLYPDRTLFSFEPKLNKYRRRVENNWDYCLTYPYQNLYNHDMIMCNGNSFNGLFGEFTDQYMNKVTDISTILDDSNELHGKIYVRTFVKNSLNVGDKVVLCLIIGTGVTYAITDYCKVNEKGINGYYSNNYFGINTDGILSNLYINSGGTLQCCYVAKVVDGHQCKYYIRKFKRIPNFYGSNVNQNNGVTDTDIDDYKLVDFNSNLSKIGFSLNAYNDKVCQINYNCDVNLSGLKDNYGRDLSEIYLTIVKNNRGYEEWYNDSNYTADTVTFSHCFGNVSSGIDMPPFTVEDSSISSYNISNVHRLHNIDKESTEFTATTQYFCEPDEPLESGITISGDSGSNGVFYGDICEFDENNLVETRLDFVRHRFNTAQREAMNVEYSSLTVDTITCDDYWETGFSGKMENYAKSGSNYFHANLAPEGYYYQPHYPIKLKEYSDVVNEGYHTRMKIVSVVKKKIEEKDIYEIVTESIHYIETGDILYVYSSNTRCDYQVTDIDKSNLYSFRVAKKNGLVITTATTMYKPNVLKPTYAYELNDGTGRYVWKEPLSTEEISINSELYDMIFTNGSNYIHKDINFYLRRQDPYGDYKMTNYSGPDYLSEVDVLGNEKDVSYADYLENGETTIC